MKEFLDKLEDRLYYGFKGVVLVLLACAFVIGASAYQLVGAISDINKANQILDSIDETTKAAVTQKTQSDSENDANSLFNITEESTSETIPPEQKASADEISRMERQYGLINDGLVGKLTELVKEYCSAYTRYASNQNQETEGLLLKCVTKECFDKYIKPYKAPETLYRMETIYVSDYDKMPVSAFGYITMRQKRTCFLFEFDYVETEGKWLISRVQMVG